MIFVVDASVAVKWFVEETGREKARALLRSDFVRYAPDIVFCEVVNALSKKVVASQISEEQASRALDELPVYLPYLCPTSVILRDAFDLSLRLKHPVPDCLYLACARHLGATLVSADQKFMGKCSIIHAAHCIPLDDWSPPEIPAERVVGLEFGLVTKLLTLQSTYDQTKRRATARLFDHDVVAAAGERLLRTLTTFDTDELAYVTALGWLGALDPRDRDDESVGKIWQHYLRRARASQINPDTLPNDMPDILPSLGYLNAGLRYLSRLSETPDPRDD